MFQIFEFPAQFEFPGQIHIFSKVTTISNQLHLGFRKQNIQIFRQILKNFKL